MSDSVQSLDTLAAALSDILGVERPAQSAAPSETLVNYCRESFAGEKADRIFMYNPDAIGQWVRNKYAYYLPEVEKAEGLNLPFRTVMPSVTPVCFGTMYTGAQPAVHGIQSYTKPVIKIDTLFDAVLRAGKKAVILGDKSCSMAHIFLERKMDYFTFDSVAEINAKACELILEDKYDLMCVYNGNYDSIMHKYGPESPEALAELRLNSSVFGTFAHLIENHWQQHNTLLGFAMDHGCHEIDGGCGSHGLDMPEDIDICHFYKALPAKRK